MKIAFFDSGVGGLTVLHDAMIQLGHHDYIYYADTDNVPYGIQSKSAISRHVGTAMLFLSAQKIDILVVACNTATSAVIKSLRDRYAFPIIGMEPAIKPALKIGHDKKIILFATKRTIGEHKLQALIEKLNAESRVLKSPLQKLVRMAENFDFTSEKLWDYLGKKLNDHDWSEISAIVLGCTHFLYYKNHFQKLIPEHVRIIDGNQGTINRLAGFIDRQDMGTHTSLQFFESGRTGNEKRFQKYLEFYAGLNQD